jgi:hypothetical protein
MMVLAVLPFLVAAVQAGDFVCATNADICVRAASSSGADTFHVSRAGRHVPPFTTWEQAATNIQAAVDIAPEGATILVKPGKYTGAGDNVVTINRSLTLQGESGNPADVVIDGEGARRDILVTLTDENATVTIAGVTITNGLTAAAHGYGAGICLKHDTIAAGTAEIRQCVIAGNINASPKGFNQGGGLASRGRAGSDFHAIVTGCVFSGNTVSNSDACGGGVSFLNTRLTMANCLVENNRAAGAPVKYQDGYGGGVDVVNASSGSVIRCSTFQGNFAKTSGSGGGGGLRAGGTNTDLLVENCNFEDNKCLYGSAVMQPDGRLTLLHCRLATNLGGKAFYQGWGNSAPTTRIIDCSITGGRKEIQRGRKGDLMVIDNSWKGSKRDPAVIINEKGEVRLVRTIDDWKLRRAAILKNIEQVAGPLPDISCFPEPELKVLQDDVLDGKLRRQKIEYFTDSRDNPRVMAWLFSPTPSSCLENGAMPAKSRAAVLCLHQTNHGIGKNEPAGLAGDTNMFYALELARLGFVTLAPDFTSFGEYPAVMEFSNNYASATMKGIADHIQAVNILCKLPCVDPERIGCIGHSLGGFNTIMVAVFEPRIKVIVSSCGYVGWRGYAELAGDLKAWANPRPYMPRISSAYQNDPEKMPFDLHEVVAALAPRPLFVNAPLGDNIGLVDNVRETLTASTPIYALYGAADVIQSEHPGCGHSFPSEVREKAYLFLERHLVEKK